MAELGISELQAVNMILAGVTAERITTLEADTAASEAGAARYQLNRSIELVMAAGWKDNTDICKSVTAADIGAGVYKVTLDSDVLAVRGSGPHHYRNFGIRAGFLWDLDQHTDSLGSAVTIYLDIVRSDAWADIAPRLKHVIVHHATLVHQRRRRGDQVSDAMILQELMQHSAVADLRYPRMDGPPMNRAPLFLSVPAPAAQQGQQNS